MNPIPQPETNQLVDEVFGYIEKKEVLNVFCKRRLLNAVKKQPTLERVHVISSLIYTVAGEKELAKEHAYLGLEFMEQPATVTHALMAFQLNGFNLDVVNAIDKYSYLLDDLEFAKAFTPFLASFPNISWIERIESMLIKTGKVDFYCENMDELNLFTKNAILANEMFGIDKSVIGNISELVATVTSQGENVILTHSRLSLSPSCEWFSLVYYVEVEDSSIGDLNWKLGEKLIEFDLDTLPLVARFELLPSNIRTLRELYVS